MCHTGFWESMLSSQGFPMTKREHTVWDSRKKPHISHTQETLYHPLHCLVFALGAFFLLSRGETPVKILLACFIKAGQNISLVLFSCLLSLSHSFHLIFLLQKWKEKVFLEWYMQMKRHWWELRWNVTELKIMHRAKQASGLLVDNTNNNGVNHNNNSNVLIITAATLLHLSPFGTVLFLPFLRFPKSKHGIRRRAWREGLCPLWSVLRLMKHS